MAAGDERRKNAVVLSRVRRVQRRLDAEVALKVLVAPAWCAVTAAAVWRFVVQRHVFTAGAVCVALALGTWLWLMRRRRATLEEAAVIADRRAGAGGLLLTRLEVPVGAWELELNQRVREVTPPPIEVRRSAGLTMLALLAGVVAFLVPLPPRTTRPVSSAAATRVDALQEKLEALAKEEPADEAAQNELQRLREELQDGTFDAADWEAADTLDQALDKKAAEAQAELSRAEQAAKSLDEAMTGAQGAEGTTREQEELEQALMQLADGKAQTPQEALQQALGEQAQQQGQQGEQQGQQGAQQGQQGEPQGQQGQQPGGAKQGQGPSKAQLSQLQRALENRQQQLARQFSENHGQTGKQRQASSGPGQPQKGPGQGGEQGQQSQQGQNGNSEAHLSHLGEGASAAHGWEEPRELRFGAQASMDPDRLKFEPLPDGNGGEAQELFGLRAANPRPGKGTPAAPGNSAAATGVQARGNDDGALLPRNRELIKRYFEK